MAAFYWLHHFKLRRFCFVIFCSSYPKSLIHNLLCLYTQKEFGKEQRKVKKRKREIMASCSMTSAASGFLGAPNVISSTSTNRSSMLMLTSKKNSNSRLIVRAEEVAAPAAATAPVAKPPPIGPKRGTKVCTILTYFWSNSFSVFTKWSPIFSNKQTPTIHSLKNLDYNVI